MLVGRKITVLGAGIGGLAAARALAMRGAEVTLLEQAEAIREVGAGLQISPNGAHVLAALGLEQALEGASLRSEAVDLIDGPSGMPLARLDLARLREGQAFRFIHRARLIEILAEGARAAGVAIELGRKVDRVVLGAHPPQVLLTDGTEVEADLLIGAEGLHSKVREALNGQVAPFFTHQVAWRALIAEAPEARPVAEIFMAPRCHLVSYPLAGGMRNIVAVQERSRWVEESWSLTDDEAALRAAFAGFAPRVQEWLAQVEAPGLWGLFRHPVAARWAGEGAAILGDAAHPTLPFLAQGAVMALEDAWVLAASLDTHPQEAAFAAYQAARLPRATAIVEAANRNARNYHLSGMSRRIAHLGLRGLNAVAPEQLLRRFDWLYDHDVTQGAGRAAAA